MEIINKTQLKEKISFLLFIKRVYFIRKNKSKNSLKIKFLYEDSNRFYLVMENYHEVSEKSKNKKILIKYEKIPKLLKFKNNEFKIKILINELKINNNYSFIVFKINNKKYYVDMIQLKEFKLYIIDYFKKITNTKYILNKLKYINLYWK